MSENSAVAVIYEIGLLIIVASLSSELFKRLRLPALIGPILVGLVIGGPGGLGFVTNLTVIEVLALLGSVLILFTVGLEFEASAFWRAGKVASLLTLTGAMISLVAGYAVGILLGWPPQSAFLLGVVLAPSGTSVIASVLNSEAKTESRPGQTLLTACVVDDVFGILLLTIALAALSERVISPFDVTRIVAIAVIFIVVSIYVGNRLFPFFLARFAVRLSDEVFLAIVLGGGLVLAFAATQVGLAAITGAFIMGAVVPYVKVGEKLVHRLFFMKEIFAAVFFASIGLLINPFDILGFLPLAVLVVGVAIPARIVGGLLGGRISGLPRRQLMALSTGLAIRAEVSLIVAREGAATGLIVEDFLPVAATAVILSMLLLTPIFTRLVRRV